MLGRECIVVSTEGYKEDALQIVAIRACFWLIQYRLKFALRNFLGADNDPSTYYLLHSLSSLNFDSVLIFSCSFSHGQPTQWLDLQWHASYVNSGNFANWTEKPNNCKVWVMKILCMVSRRAATQVGFELTTDKYFELFTEAPQRRHTASYFEKRYLWGTEKNFLSRTTSQRKNFRWGSVRWGYTEGS